MEKIKVKFWVDLLMFLAFLIIAVSGFVLWLVLPRGSGREGYFIFERSQWVFIHDWLSVLLIILLLIHLILNWRWIIAMFKRIGK